MPDARTNNTLPTYNTVRMLGVRVHDVTMAEALDWADRVIQAHSPQQVATVNVEFLIAARQDQAFRRVLNDAGLCVPDSIGILLNARILGQPLRERVPGVDLVKGLAALAARRGYHLFLLGAASGVAERAGEQLVAANPGLTIAGTYAGSPDPAEQDGIVKRIRSARPDILLVAYGAPKQDRWIARNIDRMEVPLCIGVGGTLDYLAGVVKRAPPWICKLGLEWLYRLYRQPWRWRRMLALPYNLGLVLEERIRQSRTTSPLF
jgi:N-acetylglucosaminyldiphosphoundecaprenol N-acetyl-beta-D-mannosaminyltransferase